MPTTRLRPLLVSDETVIRPWLRSYLREHLGWWSESVFGEPWSPEMIADHLERHDLVSSEWRNLTRAADASDSFVQVAHSPKSPLGVVWGEVRTDRYLCSPMGVVSWIFVSPTHRREGIAGLLLEATNAWFLWRGVAGRTLHVTTANEAACALYSREGYRVADHRLLAPIPTSPPEGEP